MSFAFNDASDISRNSYSVFCRTPLATPPILPDDVLSSSQPPDPGSAERPPLTRHAHHRRTSESASAHRYAPVATLRAHRRVRPGARFPRRPFRRSRSRLWHARSASCADAPALSRSPTPSKAKPKSPSARTPPTRRSSRPVAPLTRSIPSSPPARRIIFIRRSPPNSFTDRRARKLRRVRRRRRLPRPHQRALDCAGANRFRPGTHRRRRDCRSPQPHARPWPRRRRIRRPLRRWRQRIHRPLFECRRRSAQRDCADSTSVAASAKSAGLGYRIRDFLFGCAAQYADAVKVEGKPDGSLAVVFEGEALSRAAISRLEKVIAALEKLSAIPRAAVGAFATHQPNPRLLTLLAKVAGVPVDTFPLIATTSGNLGSSTCGAALHSALKMFRACPQSARKPIFLASLGPGLVFGGAWLSPSES